MNKAIVLASVVALGVSTVVISSPTVAYAQEDKKVNLDLREAPIRDALKQLFDSVNVNYTLSNEVQGFVTLKVDDISFDQALRLILRNATVPLTYTKEGKIFIIKARVIRVDTPPDPSASIEVPAPAVANYEIIQLRFLDPLQLSQLLGILQIPSASQMRGGGMGGMGGGMGGMGGGMGGMGGGMGGMGGGMGGMGGGMGGMGGGMGGFGGGGFGGGRGF
jgi:type II secretory pathway component GspD/PulD (secretin)